MSQEKRNFDYGCIHVDIAFDGEKYTLVLSKTDTPSTAAGPVTVISFNPSVEIDAVLNEIEQRTTIVPAGDRIPLTVQIMKAA